MVVCGERKFADEKMDTLLNPDVIIEVLSDSTESYDRGIKFEQYRTLPSLKEYVMISQNDRKMERYYRDENGNWVLTETDENNTKIRLKAVDCELDLLDVYDKVK